MTTLNKAATKIFKSLIEAIPEGGDHIKIDNAKGAFMAVHVERVDRSDIGTHYSIAHYFEQNGDLMRDPEMVFIVVETGEVIPCYFRQDGFPQTEQQSLFLTEEGHWMCDPRMQREHARFAGMWMKNIKFQQGLS